ncbi:MAG: alpha/beta hydrolase, partial [Alphaproteobacteria bacterium]
MRHLRSAAPLLHVIAAVLAAALVLALAACAEVRRERGRAEAERIAAAAGMAAQLVAADPFTLLSYRRIAPGRGGRLVVYFEGDGLAWINRGQISDNPTPGDPLALRLAAADDAPSVLYLARPCQFVMGGDARNCAPKYWSEARFSEEVVAASSHAVDTAMAAAGARELELVGYSGGGVLATLVAARRGDVARVITIAANLDVAFWTAYHKVSPLSQSLDPAQFPAALAEVRQIAFVGGRDEVVPPAVIDHYRAALPAKAPLTILPQAEFSHDCCWVEAWPALLKEARALP